MASDDDLLRRIVREEIADVLPRFLREVMADLITTRVINGHGGRLVRRNLDPELSAKRSAAAKAMWAKVKSQLPTGLPTAPITKPRASKRPAAKPAELSEPSVQSASNEQANEQANGPPVGTTVFLEYAAAFKERYGEFPVRNAKSNALLKQLVGRLGAPEAPPVAGYYVGLNDKLYAGSGHCLTLLVRDAEKIRTLWKQGATGTTEAPSKPWWDRWPGIEEQGRELGIEQGDNPTTYRFAVLRAAFVAGRLPAPIAAKLGVDNDAAPGA